MAASTSLLISKTPPHSLTIKSTLSQKPTSTSSTTLTPQYPSSKPLRKLPGDCGLPLIGPFKDRLDYFYTQGRDNFFKTRIRQHNSTVFRVNMPPGPFLAPDPKVIALLDAASFPVLFDNSLVQKKDLFTGTFMPSTDLTGGYRTLSYLDTSEPNHAPLKKLMFFLLSFRRHSVIPEFRRTYGQLFQDVEAEIAKKGKADFGGANDQAAFNFLARSLLGKDPLDSNLGSDGPSLVTKWVLVQLGPILTLGLLPSILEDLTLHSFRLPSLLVKKDYNKLADFFRDSAAGLALHNEAERLGISREEAVHNLLFTISFNAFGGMKILFPGLIKWVGRAGMMMHGKLAGEIRTAVRANGGEVTMRSMEEMPLMKSVVYEALRIEPPVAMQYGRARRDFVVESHDAGFEVRAGELLFGYQPFATKDPRVFDRPEEFVGDRFVGEEGEKLLKHVLWSNGPETESPTTSNKQCVGKNFVVLVARMLLVELFMRYDSFDIEVGTSSPLGSSVQLTSLKRASF